MLGALDVDVPDRSHGDPQAVSAYVRPHELELDRLPRGRTAMKAEIVRINAASAVVKVEAFSKDFGIAINVDVPRERYEELQLKVADAVFVFPKRVRMFTQNDFQI
jgi:sulfate transport system ATP-binding protein